MDEASVKQKMQTVLDMVIADVGSIRTGKASTSLVDNLEVMVYGGSTKMKINELGTISAPDAQTVVIDPWDKSIIGDIRKGIELANLGLTPSIDGEIIRIGIQPMTGEDRDKYIKVLGTKIENGRVMVRQIRGDVMHDIKKMFEDKEITEDDKFAEEKKLQELTDDFIAKIEDTGKKKEEELRQL